MGVDFQTANFITYCARKMGVDMGRTLVLGRQHQFLSAREARFLLKSYRYTFTDADIGRLVDSRFADDLLRFIGAKTLEFLDYSDYEGAHIVHDLNLPIDARHQDVYTCVIDGGTIEHVFDFPRAIDNCMKLTKVGGHLLSITAGNNFLGHGFYQFSPELFFNLFCERNGFRTIKVFLGGRFDKQWYDVPDPAAIKQRVQLVNSERTYILTLAQRIAKPAGVLTTPQQSHYEQNWEARENLDFGKGGALAKYKKQITDSIGRTLGIDALHKAQQLYQNRTFSRIFRRHCRKINPLTV